MSRVLWAGLIGAQCLFGLTVVVLILVKAVPHQPQWYPMLLYVSAVTLAGGTAMAYFARSQMYKANWRGQAVTPRGYVMGNVVLLVLLNTVTLVALLAVLMIGRVMPTLLIALLALLVQCANFPHGRPMQPRGPEGRGV